MAIFRKGEQTMEPSKKAELKRKAVHELIEMVEISLYLWAFFCAMSTYRMLLLDQFNDVLFDYGAALINALVVAKVILIGDAVHVGKQFEAKRLLISSIYKAFMFGLLLFAFHIVEEVIKLRIHGETLAFAYQHLRIQDFLGRALVVFCAFVPLFAFRELRRVVGESEFNYIFYGSGAATKTGASGK
jgi:hypothetical protein